MDDPNNSGAAAPAPSPAPAAGAPPAPSPAPAPAGAPAPAPAPNVLAGAAPPAPAPAGTPAAPNPAPPAPAPAPASNGPFGTIPEKFQVKDAAGNPDLPASWAKVEEHRSHLERKLGSGDVPPATVDGYKVNVPEALADKVKPEELAATQGVKDLLAKLHGVGASQKVVDVAVGELLQRGLALREAMPVLQASDCEATLRGTEGWKTDAEYGAKIAGAFKAGQAIFGADWAEIVKDHGNDARIIKGLAGMAAEMAEDRGVSGDAQQQLSESLDALMTSKPYLNANDPQHAAVLAKVSALTAKLAGTRDVTTGRSMTFKTG